MEGLIWAGTSAECLTCVFFTYSLNNPVRGILLLPPFNKKEMAGVEENLLQALEILDVGGESNLRLACRQWQNPGGHHGPCCKEPLGHNAFAQGHSSNCSSTPVTQPGESEHPLIKSSKPLPREVVIIPPSLARTCLLQKLSKASPKTQLPGPVSEA